MWPPENEIAARMMRRVSPIYGESHVARWLYYVMGLEMEEAGRYTDELSAQAFPETATWGLVYWEQQYGIAHNPDLSLEERRRAVIARKNARESLNPARLAMLIEGRTGTAARVIADSASYTFRVEMENGGVGDYPGLKRYIESIKPSHLSFGMVVTMRGVIEISDILRYAGFVYNYVLDGRWVLGEGLPFVSNANWREEAGHLVLTEALKGELAAYIAPRIDKALLNGSYAVEEFKVKEAASGGVVLEYEVTDSAAPAVIESIALLSGGVTWMEERTEIHRAGNLSLRHEISIEAGGN